MDDADDGDGELWQDGGAEPAEQETLAALCVTASPRRTMERASTRRSTRKRFSRASVSSYLSDSDDDKIILSENRSELSGFTPPSRSYASSENTPAAPRMPKIDDEIMPEIEDENDVAAEDGNCGELSGQNDGDPTGFENQTSAGHWADVDANQAAPKVASASMDLDQGSTQAASTLMDPEEEEEPDIEIPLQQAAADLWSRCRTAVAKELARQSLSARAVPGETMSTPAQSPQRQSLCPAPQLLEARLSDARHSVLSPRQSLLASQHRQSVLRKSLVLAQNTANVVVACRFRPLVPRELKAGDTEVATFEDFTTVCVEGRPFKLDCVFPPSTEQHEVYEVVARPIVQDILEGYNGTIMAYGPTGSGKTYTMEGPVGSPGVSGIVPRMVSTLFDGIDSVGDAVEFELRLSAVEIYMEFIIDLLRPPGSAPKQVRVREDAARGVRVDAAEIYAASEADVFAVAHTAQAARSVAATQMNARSSRSHYIFMLRLSARDKETENQRHGLLYLVDLAGSEKVHLTGAEGQTLEEAKKINRSLSCLGNVISALTEDRERQHVPYRDSKLTRVLQQSLGGNAKTAFVTTCSPARSSAPETLAALRFSERVKSVRNAPRVNEQKSMEQLMRDLECNARRIQRLEQECASLRSGVNITPTLTPCASTCELGVQTGNPAESADQSSCEAFELSEDQDPDSEFLGIRARAALVHLRHQLLEVTRERDALREQLDQIEECQPQQQAAERGAGPEPYVVPAGRRSPCRLSPRSVGGGSEDDAHTMHVQRLEAECAGLRQQVTKLGEARAFQRTSERQLREEVMLLRDAAARSSQEVDFLRRERKELQQLLQTCCSGDLEEERNEWMAVLSNEERRREEASEHWRDYLSNRIHKVVDLEIKVDELRHALAFARERPRADLSQAEIEHGAEAAGGDCDEPEFNSWFQRLPLGSSGDGHHPTRVNIAMPVRRRPLNCEPDGVKFAVPAPQEH